MEDGLRPHAGTLQQLFRFNSYRQVARKSIRLDFPGEGGTDLPDGQSLALKAGPQKGATTLTEVTWVRNGKRLVHTRIQLRKGAPAVLGGPRSSRESIYLVILELE